MLMLKFDNSGTGNVLKIQQMLHVCSEVVNKDDPEESGDAKTSDKKEAESTSKSSKKESSKSDEKKKSKTDWGMSKQAIAVLGIALVGMGEEIGSEMAFRTFGHMVMFHCISLHLLLTFLSNYISCNQGINNKKNWRHAALCCH